MLDTANPVIRIVTDAYCAAKPIDGPVVWVMDRSWYDRLRAACCTEEQERARAREHAHVWVAEASVAPRRCPACVCGPFADMGEYLAHLSVMADPAFREPDPRDELFAIRIEVRDGGGQPHLERPGDSP